uniref:membrane protein FAM174A-like n=1 Tax=Pristiophorus japonicus TaxID=55135 RepID=UPI00398EF692
MEARQCRPQLLWLLMWAGNIMLGVQVRRDNATSPGTGPSTAGRANSSSPALGAGGKAKKGGEYSNAPGRDQTMMIQRALYVLVAVTALVVVYFVVRTIRMRRINRKNRKYGILNTNLENMEMRPLDQEDDDEDDTLFDVHHSRR